MRASRDQGGIPRCLHDSNALTKPRKSATRSKSPPKGGTKAKPGASEAKPLKLLAGGNPRIAKADGDAPVQAYIAGMPG